LLIQGIFNLFQCFVYNLLIEFINLRNRTLPEHKTIVVIINLGSLRDTISLSAIEELPDDLEIIVSSTSSFYTKG